MGGKRNLKIPPSLAYGDKGAGDDIPPGSHLLFECQLRKLPSTDAEEFMAQSPAFPVLAALLVFMLGAIALAS